MECKVGIFEDVIHEDDEFAHDGGEHNFGGFASRPQSLIKLFEMAVGMGDKLAFLKDAAQRGYSVVLCFIRLASVDCS